MKKFLPLAGVLGAAFLLATPASAENGFGARMMVNLLFQKGDANANGQLDPDEIAALRMHAFQRADANGDGTVSRAEQEEAASRRARRADMARMMGEEQIGRFDMNGDGAISLSEFESAPRPGFALIDVNSDGAIDRSEMDRFMAILAEAR